MSPILKSFAHKKRLFYAWILLAAICSQRLIGLVSSDIIYAMEIERQMNAMETAIAEEVGRLTGLDVRIEIQSREQLGLLMNMGYATPFVFSSETDDGQIQYYTVSSMPATEGETICADPEQQHIPPLPSHPVRASKDRLAADFCFWGLHWPSCDLHIASRPGNLTSPRWQDPFIPLNAPPPDWLSPVLRPA